jgi:hypothetical protein
MGLYRNQGYGAPGSTDINKRKKSYERWRESGFQLSHTPSDAGAAQIGTVDSSWISTMGYDKETGEAVVTFKDGATCYYIMTFETFLQWRSSPSKGRWLHQSTHFHPDRYGPQARGGNGSVRKRALAKAAKYR